ncbi:alpha/beta hydrolase [Salirhabdus sp. Marseille-P4669]|uniref:alpha/beta hydrolase n=1 Tax=Salirhabdus sp. Marseille-P4669 TaxID=2042310 RepID=UPI000C79CFAC|nr:alpha/beta hydrolase [Salirhabdus sp. Marseille-P4669]
MRKKIVIISSSIVAILVVALLLAGNYFYGESVKRGQQVELHKGAADANTLAKETNPIIQEAESWYEEQSFTTVELTSYDGLTLKANYLQNNSSNGNVVILAHGYRGKKEDMRKYVKFYYDLGFDILLPDARGHGESEGDYIGYGWHDRKDYQKWIDMLIKEYGARNIILHGNSMGAALVLMTSGEKLPSEVKGIIADSGYTTVKEELTYQLKHLYGLPAFPLMDITSLITNVRAGYTFEEASSVKQVKKNTRPLLIIHGDKDELVPTDMAYEIYEAAGGKKELWIVPDAGHTKAYDVATEEFERRVQAFIVDAMKES